MSYLKFECGARIKKQREWPDGRYSELARLMGAKPREDGRYRAICYNSESNFQHPVMPDGQDAPCMNCPSKRKSGLEQNKCCPNENDNWLLYVYVCYPKEVENDTA